MHFDILIHLGVAHECDERTDGRTDGRTKVLLATARLPTRPKNH